MTSALPSTPSPHLANVAPELVAELQHLLLQQGEAALVEQVAELALVDRCRCGDSLCSSFHTVPQSVGFRRQRHRTIPLRSEIGILTVDVIGSRIVHVEVLRRDDIRAKIIAAIT